MAPTLNHLSHGGHISGEAEYLERCTKRTRPVANFPKSEEFYENILTGRPSSIPRWKYARTLEEAKSSENRPRTAESSAALLESTREIIKGVTSPLNFSLTEKQIET